jgi:hypothetical protein
VHSPKTPSPKVGEEDRVASSNMDTEETIPQLIIEALSHIRLTEDEKRGIDVSFLQEEDMSTILKGYKDGHPAGWDGITIALLKSLAPNILHEWFISTANGTPLPSVITNALLQPIPKPNGDLRPISIESSIIKIFRNVLHSL